MARELSEKDREILMKRGVWIHRTSAVPYRRIIRVEVIRGPISRSLGISDLSVHLGVSSLPGESTGELVIRGIEEPDRLRELIMERVRTCAELLDGEHGQTLASSGSTGQIKLIF
jgi:membrane protein YdbS with pleckstrin-like domain